MKSEPNEERTTANDPVLVLCEYWLRARLMHWHVHEIRKAIEDNFSKLTEDYELGSTFHTYLAFWLSALFVVAEGFKELKLRDGVLEALIDAHIDSLRLYRNATFHYQRNPEKHVQFYSVSTNRLNWAEDMHAEFESYFRAYLTSLGAEFPELDEDWYD